jgi:ABC-2 type transport system ATP-binding protein
MDDVSDHYAGQITVEGLTKRFGPVTAVQDLSFAVQPGSVTGFLGPNGAGKTTTMRMLLGLVTPTAGTALIGGLPFHRLGRPARVVGAVLEAQGFHPRRTGLDHLLVYAAAVGSPDARAAELMQLVGLGSAARQRVGGYSLGMKQRLALATALIGDPQILVLDEPANGLDPEGISWLRTFLQSFARTGRTVLISSHLLAEIEQTVDQVVIISAGRTVYQGRLDQLRDGQQGRVLVRPSDPDALVAALRAHGITRLEPAPDGRVAVLGVDARLVGDIALAAGVAVYGMYEEKPDLERLFFQLTSGAPGAGPGPVGYPPPLPAGWVRSPGDPQGRQRPPADVEGGAS